MHIRLIAVGTRMPVWVGDGFRDYARRLPRQLDLKLAELPVAARRGNFDIERLRAEEGERILRAAGTAELIALDERGDALDSLAWSRALQAWMREGRDVALAIGGPDGHAPEVLARARACWSLSALTLPHTLVRVVVAEQLYRAWSLAVGHPYHRG